MLSSKLKKHSLLVALSGGCDSVALLLRLLDAGATVHAAHCNFHLRGEESDRDEAFCRQLCRERGVELHVAHFDTRAYAELHRQSIETAARNLRYHYFEQLRRDLRLDYIAVAHHRDDQAETVLMHLLRGSGLHGLTGMRPVSGHIVRPLLGLSRKELEDYLRAKGQPYVTDSTNLERDATRNRIRLDVLPLLESIYPHAAEAIARCAGHLAEAEKVVRNAVAEEITVEREKTLKIKDEREKRKDELEIKGEREKRKEETAEQENSSLFPLHSSLSTLHSSLFPLHSSLSTLPSSLSTLHSSLSTLHSSLSSLSLARLRAFPSPSLLLHEWLAPLGFTPAQTEGIARHLDAQTGTTYQSATHTLAFDRDRLVVAPTPVPLRPLVVPEPGTYQLADGRKLRVSIAPRTAGFQPSREPGVATLDAATVRFPLTLRPCKAGDRFQPFGMSGTKLVSDLLADRRVSPLDKLRQAVVAQQDGAIVWLPGHRAAHPQRVTPSTARVLTLALQDPCKSFAPRQ